MSHAEYRIVDVQDDRVFIVDVDQGSKTITNDAEYVWQQINQRYPNRRLIYRDTMNRWDEITYGKNEVNFKPYNEYLPF